MPVLILFCSESLFPANEFKTVLYFFSSQVQSILFYVVIFNSFGDYSMEGGGKNVFNSSTLEAEVARSFVSF